jgi:hypothetical protein
MTSAEPVVNELSSGSTTRYGPARQGSPGGAVRSPDAMSLGADQDISLVAIRLVRSGADGTTNAIVRTAGLRCANRR